MSHGENFYRWRMQHHTTARRLVRLSDDANDQILPCEQSLQRRHGELRRAHEDEAQRPGGGGRGAEVGHGLSMKKVEGQGSRRNCFLPLPNPWLLAPKLLVGLCEAREAGLRVGAFSLDVNIARA